MSTTLLLLTFTTLPTRFGECRYSGIEENRSFWNVRLQSKSKEQSDTAYRITLQTKATILIYLLFKIVSLQSYMQNPIKLQQAFQEMPMGSPLPQSDNDLPKVQNKKEEILAVTEKQEHVKKNFKWSYEEHAKYIHFLEMNKQKVKSKMVRKSNAFFREMEHYIKTKTSVQCRSHHQKFEEKYKFPHRIITGQKKHIPAEIYQQILQELANSHYNPQIDHYSFNGGMQPRAVQKPSEGVDVSCQTEICDLRLEYRLKSVQNQQQRMGNQLHYNYVPTYGFSHFPFPFIF